MKKLLVAALTGAATIALLAGCAPTSVKQMPTATPSLTTAPSATKAPSDLLPKNEASKQTPKLLGSATLARGVKINVYKVGTGTVVAEQLKANPTLATAGAKVGDKVTVVRYTIVNNSNSSVAVNTFNYNGVFVGGNGKAAATDNGFASATARLGLNPTPVAQFTSKTGVASSWSLKAGASATWNADWVLQGKGVLAQNFNLNGKAVNDVRLNLS